MSQWIAIAERLPEEGRGVLITDGAGIVTAAIHHNKSPHARAFNWSGFGFSGYEWEFDLDDRHITHWMELPALPGKSTT